MSFSQAWDASFRAILIYLGVIFFWLGLIERYFASQDLSVVLMNVVGIAAAAAFFLRIRKQVWRERSGLEAEVNALTEE